jgi:hypothetical protein
MNAALATIVERIRRGDARAELTRFQLGRETTPQTVIRLLGPPDNSGDDGVELFFMYSTPLGTLSFTFAHYRLFFGPQRQKLTSVELDASDRNQSVSANER